MRRTIPGVLLLVAYYLLSLLNSPEGFLSPDTGGKVATLKMMAAHHTFTNVDVGYWAARWDPQGLLHPLYYTTHIGDRWVQVTTLPMVLLGEPLYRAGGYRLALLLPMLGSIACAYAARALATRFGADRRRQWWAFWLVGIASPVTIYALDFWEHSLGLALMAWALVALLELFDASSTRRQLVFGVLGGLAFGAAASLRTEAFVYLAVAVLVLSIALLRQRRGPKQWLAPVGALAAGIGIALGANHALSTWILGTGLREGRTAGAAAGAFQQLGVRLREGLVTTFGLSAADSAGAILLGVLAALALGLAAARGRTASRPLERPLLLGLLGAAGVLFVGTFVGGLGWMSGITAAAPLAVAGAVAAFGRHLPTRARVTALSAAAALPVVWAFQWTGGATIGWAGRYVLATMFVLVVIGVTALPSLKAPVPQVFVALSVAVTVFGLAWMAVSTHDQARVMRTLNARPEPVLVADGTIGQLPRYGGATYDDHRWLTTQSKADRELTARVVEEAGYRSFAMVDNAAARLPHRLGDFTKTGTSSLTLFGSPVTVTSYSLVSSGARN